MLHAGVGQSSDPSAEKAIRQAAGAAMRAAGTDRADVALVFFTVDYVPQAAALTRTLVGVTNTERVVGCSGVGVLSGEGEIDEGPGVVVAALASDSIQAQPFLYQPLRDRDRQMGPWLAQTQTVALPESKLLVLFPDTYNNQPGALVGGIEDCLGFLPVVGAGCSENGTAGKTYQLRGAQMTTNAVAGLLLGGAFEMSVGVTQGCQPVTEPMTVTKAEKNLLFEINQRPAFEVFAEAIGAPLLADLRRALAYVFVGVPARRERNTVEPGGYLVRNIVGIEPQKGILAIADEIWEGEQIIFTLRDGQRAREDLTQMLQRQGVWLGGQKPQLGLYFNCCARGRSLYGIPGIDTAYIHNALGDFPLIGFCGNFELGPLGGENHLLAYTGVLALIREI
jgi:small ligand-binding sensory domain FIST